MTILILKCCAVSVLLGILVLAQWPFSGLWLIGVVVGVEMLVYGWSWVMLAILMSEYRRHIEHEEPHGAAPAI